MQEIRKEPHKFCHVGGGHIRTSLSISTSPLQIVIGNAILIGNRLMHNLKVMVISVGHNKPGYEDSFSKASNFRYYLCAAINGGQGKLKYRRTSSAFR
jgi:hypothetical protein